MEQTGRTRVPIMRFVVGGPLLLVIWDALRVYSSGSASAHEAVFAGLVVCGFAGVTLVAFTYGAWGSSTTLSRGAGLRILGALTSAAGVVAWVIYREADPRTVLPVLAPIVGLLLALALAPERFLASLMPSEEESR